ncbi:unnamed protein product [Brachionus calyciflorus]|uniref:Uncharacterized protein n=1 Tax=Brachionus calyciflorus TaxID=104777 RepID=A0A813SH21_9BILA|nr:unnamed protein product [Brachionus calyciflorus]
MYYNLNECESDDIEIDFLFPNGFFYSYKFSKNLTLKELKNKLWSFIKETGDHFWFKLAESYYFSAITSDAKQIEFRDSNSKLSDLDLISWSFKVNEYEKDDSEKINDSELEYLTGFCLFEVDELKDAEIIEYRIDLLAYVRNLMLNELNQNDLDMKSHLFKISYPPNLEINLENLSYSTEKGNVEDECLSYLDIAIHDKNDQSYQILNISVNQRPSEIIREYFRIKLESILDKNLIEELIKDYEKTYVLNVCGCNEILYGNQNKMGDFKYIKKCIWLQRVPCFYLRTYDELNAKFKKYDPLLIDSIEKTIHYLIERHEMVTRKIEGYDFSIFNENSFKVLIDYVALIPKLYDCDKIFFKTALFVGKDLVTKIVESDRYDLTMINQDVKLPIQMNQRIDFDIKIKALPKFSKFCFCLYYTTKKKKTTSAFAFLSLNLYDFESFLINGKKKLFMWSLDSITDSFENISQFHTTGINHEKNSSYLQIEFLNGDNIKFPDDNHRELFYSNNNQYGFSEDFITDINGLEFIINKNSLAELSILEKRYLWKNRNKLLEYPYSLAKLAKCVDWTDFSCIQEYHKLLNIWPLIKPIDALLLLHSDIPDTKTRNFAVNCLEINMKNEEVEFYLLQLVQAIKNEPHLKNNLSKFILNRAFQNCKIGYKLFWILKTEINNPKYRDRFRIMLEILCRKKAPYFNELVKQVQAVNTLKNLSQTIKSFQPAYFNLIKKSFLKDKFSEDEFKQALSNLVSPVDDIVCLGTICPSECFLLKSAKRPLYLTWQNEQIFNHFFEDTFKLIFKNGDDLRQDMLTIQAIKLMDIIWKSENLDLKMLIYDVFPTGDKLGFIEIVKDSNTVFDILTQGGARGRYQIDDFQLFKWISDNNPKEKFNQAIDNFTKSCAGFCVATFLLGIGDRHPSNIMINKEGKLFHIDFGHFLGHFKEKFGIKRERVPFVLTEHFTKVISKGAIDPIQTYEFQKFKSLCENAYMIIRRHSKVLIDLFVIMLSSGMSELKSTDDIDYLKNKLEPEEYFIEKWILSHKAIPLGLAGSLPYILSSHKVSYADQGTFSFAFWPFSLKLLWAPLIDSIFIKKFGRRKSWLVPIQYLLGLYMIYFSFYANELIENDRSDGNSSNAIYKLTFIFVGMSFLAATQDIVVDGWALTMLSKENMSWSSTCESTGGTFGWFTGNVLFLVFESAEFSNKYIRPLFGLDTQAHGILTLETFMKFFGYIFLLTTTLVIFFKKEKEVNEDSEENAQYSLGETYKLALKIAMLPSILKLIFLLLTLRVAFSIESISFLKLVEAGVPKEKMGLLAVPLTPFQVLLPFLISKIVHHSNPFQHFAKAYFLRLILILVYCTWVYLAPMFKDENQTFPFSFFVICILLQALHSVVLYSMHMPIMYFFTKISDKNIGATYLTFLNTLSNLTRSSINTASLFIANFLTVKYCKYENNNFEINSNLSALEKVYFLKSQNQCSSKGAITECNESGGKCETYLDAYYFQTIICFLFGLIWLIWFKKYLYELQKLPASAWKIHLNKIKLK